VENVAGFGQDEAVLPKKIAFSMQLEENLIRCYYGIFSETKSKKLY